MQQNKTNYSTMQTVQTDSVVGRIIFSVVVWAIGCCTCKRLVGQPKQFNFCFNKNLKVKLKHF